MKQIAANPGGLVLDYREKNGTFGFKDVIGTIENRMGRSLKADTDIMLIFDQNDIKVLRYKK